MPELGSWSPRTFRLEVKLKKRGFFNLKRAMGAKSVHYFGGGKVCKKGETISGFSKTFVHREKRNFQREKEKGFSKGGKDRAWN